MQAVTKGRIAVNRAMMAGKTATFSDKDKAFTAGLLPRVSNWIEPRAAMTWSRA
jgi:hypothetical protein